MQRIVLNTGQVVAIGTKGGLEDVGIIQRRRLGRVD
jgi:hypothetical protein